MVDVGGKAETARSPSPTGRIRMSAEALAAIRDGSGPKGDVLAAARIAGIMAAKKTGELIPLCHPLRARRGDASTSPSRTTPCAPPPRPR